MRQSPLCFVSLHINEPLTPILHTHFSWYINRCWSGPRVDSGGGAGVALPTESHKYPARALARIKYFHPDIKDILSTVSVFSRQRETSFQGCRKDLYTLGVVVGRIQFCLISFNSIVKCNSHIFWHILLFYYYSSLLPNLSVTPCSVQIEAANSTSNILTWFWSRGPAAHCSLHAQNKPHLLQLPTSHHSAPAG